MYLHSCFFCGFELKKFTASKLHSFFFKGNFIRKFTVVFNTLFTQYKYLYNYEISL